MQGWVRKGVPTMKTYKYLDPHELPQRGVSFYNLQKGHKKSAPVVSRDRKGVLKITDKIVGIARINVQTILGIY